jgi:hypothetical protein
MSGIGHIGELQAIAQMEDKGFSIYLPMKDKGIDFIAVKNNKSTQIQVKTSKFQKESYFWFDLHISKMIYSENTYYIFVLYVLPRRKMLGRAKNYLIIPSLDLKRMIELEEIASKKGNDDILNIFIYPDEESKNWIYRNKGQGINLTKYWNNFDELYGS